MNPEMPSQSEKLTQESALEQLEEMETVEEIDSLLNAIYQLPFADWQSTVAKNAHTKAATIFKETMRFTKDTADLDTLYESVNSYNHLFLEDRENLRQSIALKKMILNGEIDQPRNPELFGEAE